MNDRKLTETAEDLDVAKLDETNSFGLIDQHFDRLPRESQSLRAMLCVPVSDRFFD